MDFEIRVVDQSYREDTAEKSVMDLVEDIDRVLDANPTLDGLVDDCRIVNIASETMASGSYALVGALITLTARKTQL
ncbi:hypothetical protein [Candidatus Hecatella orcuttiae]|jgi:hypothetical protein|uniref:hypothetical protein n=1 Tax=Candidatus Hecatella orcuttiae TaxID=1935119 RepID=UPI002867C0F5|nr:hypothetical protein [Candidatus Hecatella orcuttiae]